ncbi:uncharacterized protein B0H18DRAFT_951236 [Fomitopsis serialis]|uniref:uncharacterized protein n=1 Tax=Fomitopsis serialis TaxID=139415 RepID=UPI0020082064|nr:uncharacterized protein B0H18DRAFT_951236 [Neoantrodia serialis]KAH9935799.1 hypothetical protein B0H18DRAFT_951236 [Neoantrodia serialis]
MITGQMNLLAGPELIAGFFNWGLLGVLNTQVYPWSFKLMVYGTLIFEWVHTGLITSGMMTIFVYDFGNPEPALETHNTWFSGPIMCGLMSMLVQMFFAWRIYMFSKSYWMSGAIVMISLVQGTFAIVAGVMLKSITRVEDVLHGAVFSLIVVWISVAAAVDIVNAIIMTILGSGN